MAILTPLIDWVLWAKKEEGEEEERERSFFSPGNEPAAVPICVIYQTKIMLQNCHF